MAGTYEWGCFVRSFVAIGLLDELRHAQRGHIGLPEQSLQGRSKECIESNVREALIVETPDFLDLVHHFIMYLLGAFRDLLANRRSRKLLLDQLVLVLPAFASSFESRVHGSLD